MWGFILMALVLIGFTWYSQPSKEQLQAQHEADSIALVREQQAAQAAEQRQKAQQAKAQERLQDSTSVLFDARNGQEQRITLENDLVRLTINTHGGLIEEAELKNYKDQQKENVRLLNADDAHMRLSLAGKQENIVTADLYASATRPAPDGPAAGDALAAAASIQTYYEQMWLSRGLSIKYIQFLLPHDVALTEPDVEIELDDYRSYHRQKRSSLNKAK